MGKRMLVDQFAEFAAAVVQSLPRDMDTTTGQGWITNREALAKVLRESLMPPTRPTPLLTSTGSIKVQPEQEFNPSARFVVSTKEARTMFSYIGDSFKERFIFPQQPSVSEAPPDGGSYHQQGVRISEIVLCHQVLNRDSLDAPIIAALGGEAKAETTLAEVYALLSKEANGENGAFFIKGYANIFYVRDITRVLRAVFVGWYGGGWSVRAGSLVDSVGWGAGLRVFSRDSNLNP